MIDCDSFRKPATRQACEYWSTKAKGRGIPGRLDIDPREMRALLPNIFLIDARSEGESFRLRLIGTRLIEWAGGDFTGMTIAVSQCASGWDPILEEFRTVVRTRLPRCGELRAPCKARNFYKFECRCLATGSRSTCCSVRSIYWVGSS